MKKIPFLMELALLILLLLVLPIGIVTYYSSTGMVKYSQQEIADSAIAKMESNSELVENMLNGIVSDVIQLVKTNKISAMREATDYNRMNKNYENVSKSFDILDGLNEIVDSNAIVDSAFFYIDNADFVIDTYKGIVRVEDFEDLSWLKEAQSGISGVWYPRVRCTASVSQLGRDSEAGEKLNTITYVYRLSKLTTSVKGTIIVNVSEKKISEYLNSSHLSSDLEGLLVVKDGTIISSPDDEMFLERISDDTGFEENIAASTKKSGYRIAKTSRGEELIAYYKTSFGEWIYVSRYPLKNLMETVNGIRNKYLMLAIAISVAGSIMAIFIATKISKPMRMLVKELKENSGAYDNAPINEIAFLATTFNKIQSQTEDLHQLLKDRETETKNQALSNLIVGEKNTEAELEEIQKMFNYNHYMVALARIDNVKQYLDDTTHDMRSYHRYMIFERIEDIFSDDYTAGCVRYTGGLIAIIINMKEYDQVKVPRTIGNLLSIIRNEATQILGGYTMTFGVSAVHNDFTGVRECVLEAEEALKKRLIEGRNTVNFWKPANRENYKYFYSYESEKKILNYLSTGDFDSIKNEMYNCLEQIKNVNDITPDNILFIFNQLAGSTIKYMSEHNINTTRLFINNENIYSAIATRDTVEDIVEYMIGFYRKILDEPTEVKSNSEGKHWDKIEKYISEHYREDIIFEDLASEMGISYSYLRKLAKDKTGKSIMDNVNVLRIDAVKGLLLHSDMNLTQIAAEVGYNNVQSMNRFFKKYEGISPGEYKNQQK